MADVKINVKCVFCGKLESIKASEEGYNAYVNGMSIQLAMSDLHSMERDVLITHSCLDCLSKTYNQPKPGESWGDVVDECENCGAPLYERNRNASGDLVCPSCGINQSEVDFDEM